MKYTYLLGFVSGVLASFVFVVGGALFELLNAWCERQKKARVEKEQELRMQIWSRDLPLPEWDARMSKEDV